MGMYIFKYSSIFIRLKIYIPICMYMYIFNSIFIRNKVIYAIKKTPLKCFKFTKSVFFCCCFYELIFNFLIITFFQSVKFSQLKNKKL